MSLTDRFIIDTNTLISALLIKNSVSYKAIEKARDKGLLVFSEETFLEFEDVLLRKKFDRYFSKEERLQIIQKTYEGINIIAVTSNLQACRDLKDDKFLNLAIDSAATCIVTGDKDLLTLHPFNGVSILSAADFLMSY
jgi:putative PIN family toxin of toxin-antitoxin system